MRRPAIVVAAAMASHLTVLGAGWVWLDHAHVEDGAAIARPGAFLDLFRQGFGGTGYYRPLMALSLSLDALVGGAGVMHFTSVAWHAIAAVMTMLASEALGLPRRAALLAGVLFAVHPLSGLVAGAIAFRSEAMITASLLTLVWAHVHKRPVLAAAALAFGALTKETALVLGPLFVLVLTLGDPNLRVRRVLVAEAGALALAVLPRLVWAPSWRAAHEELAAGDALGTRFAAVAKSAAAILAPVDRSICDAFVVTHWWQPTSLAGAVALGALGVLAWRKRGVTLLLAIAALPALQLVPVMRWWSPHYLYLPFSFAAMLLAVFLERLEPRRWLAVAVALGVGLGALSLSDGRRYVDDFALWAPEVKRQPACREAHFYLGEVERSAKRWDAAARHYEAALAAHPGILSFVDRGAALQNLGAVRIEQRRFADARRVYREALDGTGDARRRRELTYNLAAATLADGDAAEALRIIEPETTRSDALPAAAELRAAALRRLGRE